MEMEDTTILVCEGGGQKILYGGGGGEIEKFKRGGGGYINLSKLASRSESGFKRPASFTTDTFDFAAETFSFKLNRSKY